MKRKIFLTVLLPAACITIWAANNFNGPESVTYDALNNRFLVSNAEGHYISQVSANWEVSILVDTCHAPRGLFISNDTLYVATQTSVLVFSLFNDSLVKNHTIPGAGLLNDVTLDNRGYIYATDSKKHLVYKIKSETGVVDQFLDTHQNLPNGIFFHHDTKSIFVGYSKGDITLASYTLDGQLIHERNFDAYVDGIAFNKKNELFFSDWFPVGIFKTAKSLKDTLSTVSSLHSGPADISIAEINDQEYLLVPNYLSNSVDIIQLSDSTAPLFRTVK